jgi:two-component system response regulator MprA
MSTRVLLVDDDSKITSLLQRGLAYEGFEVYTAPDGEAGLEMAQTHLPHVVLLDIAMPGPDGFEVCRRLRLQNDAAIIMLTARDEVSDTVTALNMGAMIMLQSLSLSTSWWLVFAQCCAVRNRVVNPSPTPTLC